MSNDEHFWRRPPHPLPLGEQEVHVWRASLEASPDSIEHLQLLLGDEERERARRFSFEKDRRHWIVAHAILRLLLGQYLQVEPQRLRFVNNAYGKPGLLAPVAGHCLHFNLSHSGNLALYAFAYGREVGVDVEQMRTGIASAELARLSFSACEYAAWQALPVECREEAFFLCWSRKEAYIKARGKGLSLPLDQFDVSLALAEPARVLGSRENPHAIERWSLHALVPGERDAGALVVEGFDWSLSCWQWPGEH